MESVRFLTGPLAVRSSAVDEDSADASFAGQHLTLLNVPSTADLSPAIRQIWWSANSDSVITYRKRVGLFDRPSVGVVVQALPDPNVAGVMFTQNPVNGADERLIEASWGLGEAVVAARVIPDHFRMDRSGEVLERTPGLKKVAIRAVADGGTIEKDVDPELVEALCLDNRQLELLNALPPAASRCTGRPGISSGPTPTIRSICCSAEPSLTKNRPAPKSRLPEGPAEVIEQVPLFTGLSDAT